MTYGKLMGLSLGIALVLTGCTGRAEDASSQFFAMDTVMSISAYGENSQAAVDEGVALIYGLEELLSVTDENSEIWAVNHSGGQWVTLSPDTLELLQMGIALAEETAGAIDPTIYPAMTAWGFTTGDYQVPSGETLDALLPLIDYSAIELDVENAAVRIPEGVQLDLGALAKGYTSDLVAEVLREMDYGVLSLGGNAYLIGEKPDGAPWRVGIQDPEGDGYLAVISPDGGNAVITSGGYQRYFEEDGATYWHILDPETASPVDSDLISVTVIGENGLVCDGLSTALFVMGLEEACDYWREHRNFDMVLIGDQGTIYVTETMYDDFALVDGVELAVEVIAP